MVSSPLLISQNFYKVLFLFAKDTICISVLWFLPTKLDSFVCYSNPGKQDPKELDPRTVINLADRFGWCCNEQQKERFWCGVPYDELDKEETEKQVCGVELNKHDSYTDIGARSIFNISGRFIYFEQKVKGRDELMNIKYRTSLCRTKPICGFSVK